MRQAIVHPGRQVARIPGGLPSDLTFGCSTERGVAGGVGLEKNQKKARTCKISGGMQAGLGILIPLIISIF